MKSIFFKLMFLIILIGMGIFVYNYYSETYVGTEAYAITPSKIPEKKAALNSNGEKINDIYAYKYKLTFIKKDGSKDTQEVEISGESPIPLQTNSYVKAKLTTKRITEGPTTVEESTIPKKVLDELNHLKY